MLLKVFTKDILKNFRFILEDFIIKITLSFFIEVREQSLFLAYITYLVLHLL